MKSKTTLKTGWILSVFVSLVITAGAIMKLAAMPQLVKLYSGIGLLPYLRLLGITELILVGLFLQHRTLKIGFVLLTGYFGGAMAVELSHGAFFIMPGLILSVVWLAAYLRNNSIFKQVPGKQRSLAVNRPLEYNI